MEIKITKHAQDRMILHGITKEQIKTAISRGSKFKQTDGYKSVHGYITVAYKVIGKGVYKIKTVYVER